MLDFSWSELFFVAVLALLILGPKDLPQLFRMGGRFVAKFRRMYADLQGSISQLEKEVNIVSGKAGPADDSWREFLPPEVRDLPADFQPGSMTAQEHQQRRRQIDEARNKAKQQQNIKEPTKAAPDQAEISIRKGQSV